MSTKKRVILTIVAILLCALGVYLTEGLYNKTARVDKKNELNEPKTSASDSATPRRIKVNPEQPKQTESKTEHSYVDKAKKLPDEWPVGKPFPGVTSPYLKRGFVLEPGVGLLWADKSRADLDLKVYQFPKIGLLGGVGLGPYKTVALGWGGLSYGEGAFQGYVGATTHLGVCGGIRYRFRFGSK